MYSSSGRSAVCAVVLAVLAAACGARLSEEEMRAAAGDPVGSAGGGVGVADGRTAVGDVASPGGGQPDAPIDGGGDTSAGSDGAAPAGAGGPSGQAGGSQVTAPAGGNGGATDVGISATEIVLGNVSTQTGPIPGLFRGALVGAQAWAAFQNSQGGIHGRRVRIVPADDRLDNAANRAATADLAKRAFAFVGSFSVTDEGGSEEIRKTSVPDVSYAVSQKRFALPTNFAVQPLPAGWRSGSLNWMREKFPAAVTKVAGFYGDVPASKNAYFYLKEVAQRLGWRYDFDQALQPTESNYAPHVLRMRQQGSKAIVMTFDATGMARMSRAIQQQGLKIELANYGSNAYDPRFLELAGSAAEGTIIDIQQAMYGGEDDLPEIRLFNTWLKKVSPGAVPDFFAVMSWASGRLFAQAALAGPPRMTRAALIEQLKKVTRFDANGMLAPSGPGTKEPPSCFVMITVRGGKFVRLDPPGPGFICDKGPFVRL